MQQIFTDLNRSAAKVSGSVVVAMGDLPIERVTVEVVSQNPFFRYYTDMERASPTLRSEKLFALSALYQANINFVGKHIQPHAVEETVSSLAQFWQDLYQVMPMWQKVGEGKITPAEMKETYLCNHAMILRSLATVLRLAKQQSPASYASALQHIQNITWRKKDRYWQGKAVNQNGLVINSKAAESYLVANLRTKFGLVDFAH